MKTLKQIRDKVIDDLDLYEETFVDEPELNAFINEGIAKVESAIHTLYEDYFLAPYTFTVEQGVNLYDYPPDIYANKVRMLLFSDGTDAYEVKRSMDVKKDLLYETIVEPSAGCTLKWYPVNGADTGKKIRLFPDTTDTGEIELWYIRNAKVLVNDEDVCDIDEFANVVELYVKTQVYLKDGDPRTSSMAALEEKAGIRMVNTLSDMVQDDDNYVQADYDHYEESI